MEGRLREAREAICGLLAAGGPSMSSDNCYKDCHKMGAVGQFILLKNNARMSNAGSPTLSASSEKFEVS